MQEVYCIPTLSPLNINKVKEIEIIKQTTLQFSLLNIADDVKPSKNRAKFFREKFSVKVFYGT